MAETITQKTKGKAKEKPKDMQLVKAREGRELVFFVVGSYLTLLALLTLPTCKL
jgi:hypothetical protein